MKIINILLPAVVFVGLTLPISGNAQILVDDPQKQKQWRVMEEGAWDFSPDWYYYLLHKNYSGAKGKFNWKKFKFEITFDLEKSNVQQIVPTRNTSMLLQLKRASYAKGEVKNMEEPFKEEVAKEADRLVDVTYPLYKDEFDRMQKLISDGLVICMNRSKGKLARQVDELSRQNAIVCENIAYIHKSGPEGQLENSQRQKAYEEAKRDMKKIVNRTIHLTAVAMNLYK